MSSVQLDLYGEGGGYNDKGLTWGWAEKTSFFAKKSTDVSIFLSLCARARAPRLHSREKENNKTSVDSLTWNQISILWKKKT